MSDKYPRVRVTSANFRDAMYSTRRELPGDEMPFKAVPADAIVIERDELPEVHTPGVTMVESATGLALVLADSDTAASLRAVAYQHLALAEYLAAHPPVDEAQVDALHDALMTAARERPHTDAWRDVATALVRDGWHKDVTP